jgi:hypothetical protein
VRVLLLQYWNLGAGPFIAAATKGRAARFSFQQGNLAVVLLLQSAVWEPSEGSFCCRLRHGDLVSCDAAARSSLDRRCSALANGLRGKGGVDASFVSRSREADHGDRRQASKPGAGRDRDRCGWKDSVSALRCAALCCAVLWGAAICFRRW